jgi:hypothetical protein
VGVLWTAGTTVIAVGALLVPSHPGGFWREPAAAERQQPRRGVVERPAGGALGLPWVTDVVADGFIALLPVSIGVAVLRYRLFDIDRVFSRTLAYAIVTGLLVGVYAGLVLLATQVFRFHSSVAVAVSTLAAAALFAPVRRWVQRVVDRRFNRARYDAERMVTAFAARLKDAVDLDSVRDDLAGTVHRALEPEHLSVWISYRS